MTRDPFDTDGEEDDPIDSAKERHDNFMRRRGEVGRMAEEMSTFLSDQWAVALWSFFEKLEAQGFNRQEALQLVSIWYQATLAPRLKLPS